MTQSKVPLQKNLDLPSAFLEKYGTEEQCFEKLVNWRWPNGFRCPVCGHNKYCLLTTRSLFQCNKCRHQTSVKANTVFEHTRLPLTKWFIAIYFMTQNKKGISALKLKHHLEISYPAAWRMKQKLIQLTLESDENKTLAGFFELDKVFVDSDNISLGEENISSGKTQ